MFKRYKGFGRVGRIYEDIKGKIYFTQNCRKCLEHVHMNGAMRGTLKYLPERETVFYVGKK